MRVCWSIWRRGASWPARPAPSAAWRPRCSTWPLTSGTALDILAGVRLGPGKISVHPAKLGVVGHGFGGSAAVFAAAGMPGSPSSPAKAVAAIFPTFTSPPAEQPATTLKVPGLILTTPGDPTALNSNALSLSRVWDAATLRIVKGEAAGLAEGRRLTQVMGLEARTAARKKRCGR